VTRISLLRFGRLKRPEVRPAAGAVPFHHEFLREMDVLCDLSPDDMSRLEGQTRLATVRKGHVIYRQEDAAGTLFLIKRGRVRLSRLTPDGKTLELAVLEAGTFFGEMPLFGMRMRNAFAEAVEDSTLCVMSETDVERLIREHPQVALRMLGILSQRLAAYEARLEDMAYRSVAARLASALLRLESNGEVAGRTHQDLADMVGAYRETVTKLLDEFETGGWVELGRRRIRVRDRAALTAMLQ
jgi:CRP-like cAMP-binding protein